VYRTLRLVGFRDDKSVAAFRAMGGDMSNVVVVPDLALTIAAPASKPRDRRIAVAVNVPEASAGGYLGQWSRVVEMLRGKGFDVALVSNELPLDIPFYRELAARLPDLEIEGAGMDHDAYCRHLGTFSAVVSSRMHTCILAMIGGAAVVPVEGASFKITGLFQELGIARPVTRPAGDTWPVEVVAQAADACERRDTITSDVSSKLTAVRERITSMLVPRLRDAAANGIARNS
jgi:polysaccharide pyruvyl transferase WcaK-like protein